MKTLRIGVPQSGYNVDRNVRVLRDGAEYLRPWDYWRIANAINFRISKRLNPKLQYSFSKLHYPRVDVLHFFNSVSDSDTPWISTFETSLPRWGESSPKRGLQLLLRREARGFVALSEASKDIFLDNIQLNLTSSEVELIEAKTTVLHPPQRMSPAKDVRIRRGLSSGQDCRTFCFVGTDFYRKGGYEMLQAFERLFDTGQKDWKLVIVGDLNSFGDFASRTTSYHKSMAVKIVERLKEHISCFQRMSSSDIYALFKKSDYLVFPTIQDTYGYVLLEAMAQGCVPIVSNQRAIPEIIQHHYNGLMFDVPLTKQYSAVPFYQGSQGSDTWTDLLFEKLSDALAIDAITYSNLSGCAVESIKTKHNPEAHADSLMELYRRVGVL